MIKRLIFVIVLVGLCVGGMLAFKTMEKTGTKQAIMAGGIPTQTVSATKAVYSDWQPKLEAVGTLRAVNGTDVASEVPGIVESIAFESGGDVEKDAALVQLRADDDRAKLNALAAAEKLAEITLNRDTKQLQSQAVSQATVDNDTATLDSDKAQVAEQQAIVDKKTIRAPFSGHLGIRQVDIGQYVNAGTALVTLQQLDPIYVDFTLPEQSLTQISTGQKVTAKVDAYGNTVFEGEITAIDAKVDGATRNIQVRATFKNPAQQLLPGMFANVTLDVGKSEHLLTLPQTAITYNPYGNTVYIVDDSKDPAKPVARQQFVTTGATRGDQIAILSGIKEGDQIVTSGQIKLRNGMPIKINNDIEPANDANPKPGDK